ncbi:hypothetical protein GOBAR_DD27660 [Gossypium barbadense]|nr:hypothetical protein GOBAR_DD27660 [Gossypium barbadense]
MSIVRSQLQIPVGFRFLPTKEEILCDCLKPIIKGDPITSGVMMACDIYGANREPWNIFDHDLADSFWKLKKKSTSRTERTAGDGCWLGRYIKYVKNKDGEDIGYDKYFTHEFSLKDQEAAGLSDFVICEIKNKDAAVVSPDYEEIKKNKKRESMEVPSDSTNDFAIVVGGNLGVPDYKSQHLVLA